MRTNIDTMKKNNVSPLSLIIFSRDLARLRKDRSKMSDSTKQTIKEVMKTKRQEDGRT